jgi:hypothetical protein
LERTWSLDSLALNFRRMFPMEVASRVSLYQNRITPRNRKIRVKSSTFPAVCNDEMPVPGVPAMLLVVRMRAYTI